MIIRQKKNKNFTVLNNEIFRNNNISARAKGIYTYIMTLPDDWQLYKKELYTHFPEGRDSIDKAFKELEDNKYISKERCKNKDGKFDGWAYTCLESVNPTDSLKNRDSESPTSVNPQLLNTNLKQSTKETNYEKPKKASAKADKNPYTLSNLAVKRGYLSQHHIPVLISFITNTDMDVEYTNLKGICEKIEEIDTKLGNQYTEEYNANTRHYDPFALYHYLRYRKWYITADVFKHFDGWIKTWDADTRYGYAKNQEYYIYDLDDKSSAEKIETVRWTEWCDLMLNRNRSK